MKPDKAIEILSLDLTYTYPARFDELQDAIKLAINHIKTLQDIKTRFPTLRLLNQPGETPEIDSKRSLHHIKQTLESNEVRK